MRVERLYGVVDCDLGPWGNFPVRDSVSDLRGISEYGHVSGIGGGGWKAPIPRGTLSVAQKKNITLQCRYANGLPPCLSDSPLFSHRITNTSASISASLRSSCFSS
jgi:hypothetical protein